MATLAPPVAAVRTAVRAALAAHAAEAVPPAGEAVPPAEEVRPPAAEGSAAPLALVACSGGADSMALAAATAFVAPRMGWRAGLVTVDHGLQDGSHQRAQAVAAWGRRAGLSPVEVLPVVVAGRPGGPEAAARDARYQALAAAAGRCRASAVLLGHTRDDQAETVLLALARGAGPRGLAGMPARRTRDGVAWLRPLLSLSRAQTRAACAAMDLATWEDPHNTDPAYARARVRMSALPALVAALGPRVVDNLARTAALVAADNAALDGWAARALAAARAGDGALSVPALQDLPAAVRNRVLHAWARELGAPAGALSHRHVAAMAALVTDWRGQGPTHLPGGRTVRRQAGRLLPGDPGGGATAGASGVMSG